MHSIQDKLQLLKNNYRDNLDAKRVELSTLFEQALDAWDQDRLGDLYRVVHSIKGSSATFGFPGLSQAAEILETTLIDVISNDQPPVDDELDKLIDHYERLALFLQEPEVIDSADTPASQQTADDTNHDYLSTEKLTILLTDDEEFGREQVNLMLESEGHNVIQASTGAEAIMLYEQYRPDLIIMDVVMPEMNGYEAARAIKQRSGENFVPIIFLTGLTEDKELVKCIENGGDDFLIKPVNAAILHARIYAMQRISALNHKLYEYQSRTEEEITLAKHIFDKITSRDNVKHEKLNYIANPAGHFSGDILVHQKMDEDRYFMMLGDFTGHGLTAAIGAIPASDIFHSMSKKNASLHSIAEEINKKLSELLPTAHFLAATLIAVDFQKNTLHVLNCGLPSSYLFDNNGDILHEFKSNNLALGIVSSNRYNESVIHIDKIDSGSKFLCASDGFIEAHNDREEMYGKQRMFDAVKRARSQSFLRDLCDDLKAFTGNKTQHDDVTIMTLSF